MHAVNLDAAVCVLMEVKFLKVALEGERHLPHLVDFVRLRDEVVLFAAFDSLSQIIQLISDGLELVGLDREAGGILAALGNVVCFIKNDDRVHPIQAQLREVFAVATFQYVIIRHEDDVGSTDAPL